MRVLQKVCREIELKKVYFSANVLKSLHDFIKLYIFYELLEDPLHRVETFCIKINISFNLIFYELFEAPHL